MATTLPFSSRTAASNGPAVLSVAQGAFYSGAGVWPLVSDRTFQMITGPKRDVWLVKTVGILVAVVGGVLAMAGLRRRVSGEVALLGAGSAAALAGIDIVYASKGRISRVYLADAAAEIALVTLWAVLWKRSR